MSRLIVQAIGKNLKAMPTRRANSHICPMFASSFFSAGDGTSSLLRQVLCALLLTGTLSGSSPVPLTRESVQQAATGAGFRVVAINAAIPEAVRSRIPFTTFDYNDPLLETLRREYHLADVVKGAPDEWTAQLKLLDWVHRQFPDGNPQSSPRNAVEILRAAAKGEKFWCTYYAITYAECAQALGWQARKLGIDRNHGPDGMTSKHHGLDEIWSNQFQKWVVMDAQSNVHYSKGGTPLSAWEIRAEWLKDQSKEVDHLVGAPPSIVKKNPAMIWSTPDADETALFFWLYVEDHAANSSETRHIFPQDAANAGMVWYQNDSDTGRGRLHINYTRNRFLPTANINDVYWTVGVVEAHILSADTTGIRFGLESYCPNRTGYQVAWDGITWEKVPDESSLLWKLHPGWNTLRLRTTSQGGVTGPETAIAMFLEGGKN
jgi:hypothetical protein